MLLGNPYMLTIVYFIMAMVSIFLFLVVFEIVTKYKAWEQIQKGNLSVAMATGGKNIWNSQYFSLLY